jgi:hypothetical protein
MRLVVGDSNDEQLLLEMQDNFTTLSMQKQKTAI